VLFALLANGFTIDGCDLSYGIQLGSFAGADEYLRGLGSPPRRALKHSFDEPFSLELALSEPDWQLGWDILAENRAAKGRSLSMEYSYVRQLANDLPKKIEMHILRHAGEPCAAALVYSITPSTRYVVYWGDARHALPRSPMNRLVYDLVSQFIGGGADLLDCGTSTLDWVPNDGLIRFKTSVGAEPAPRFILSGAL
jgi:hypothetical protein